MTGLPSNYDHSAGHGLGAGLRQRDGTYPPGSSANAPGSYIDRPPLNLPGVPITVYERPLPPPPRAPPITYLNPDGSCNPS
jgi:hypothetical protein